MNKFLVFSFVIILIRISAFGQSSTNIVQNQYSFKYLTIDQGLSNNDVRAICQDSKGFIWIATENGLNKFDGQTITTYRNNPLDSNSISSNGLFTVFLDSKDNLWIGGSGGLDLYNSDFDNFTRFSHKDINWQINTVDAVVEDKTGKLWIGSSTGLYSYNLNTYEIQFFSNKPGNSHGIPSNRVYRLLVDKNNNIWFSIFNEGLCLFKQNEKVFQYFWNDANDPSSLMDHRIERIYEDRKGNIWLGTLNNGLIRYVAESSSFMKIIPDPNNSYSKRVRAIFKDLKGNFFIGTRAGLYIRKDLSNTFDRYAYEAHNFSSLSQNSILCSFIDKSGTLWIGTFAGGVNYTNLNKKEFVYYSAGKNDNHYLNGANIYAITEDPEGNLWIGGDNGLNYLDRTTHTFKYYTNNPDNIYSLSYNDTKALEWDKKGNLWVGTNGGGLNYLNVETGKFKSYMYDPDNPNSIAGNQVFGLFKDTDNNLWIIINSRNDFLIDILPSGSNNFKHLNIRTNLGIEQDKNGNVYLGGVNGFWIFSKIDSAYNFISNDTLFGEVNVIRKDTKDKIWIGSDKGLVSYDLRDNSFNRFSEDNGYPISEVFGILEDGKKNLWVSTNNGLIKLANIVEDIKNIKTRVFDTEDGLQSKQFNFNAYYKCKSGELAFGGINGVNIFYPDMIVENTTPADVIITDLKVFNVSVPIGEKLGGRIILNKAISVTNEITLGPKQKVFTLEFASPQNANSEKNTFKIKLEGLDKDWQFRKSEDNYVTYTNLPAGKYTFMVNAANNDGIWNKNPVTLKITIIPPIWKAWWFIFMLIVLGILIAYAFYKTRIKQFKANEKLLKKAVDKRTTELNKSNEELLNQKQEILTQNNEILTQNEEIQMQNEELQAQREMIEEKNTLLEEANVNLEFLVDFGEQLTSELNMSDIFTVIEKYISSIVDIDIIGFGIVNEKSQEIVFSNFSERGTLIPPFTILLSDTTSMAVYCYKNKEQIVCNNLIEDYKNYISEIATRSKIQPQSVLYFPLSLGDKIIGVLTIQNYKLNAFSNDAISIIQKLISYITIGIDNAFAYELVKKQKEQIEKHKEYLEEVVAERTKNLEVAKNKAEESDKLKSAFLANMSHEIRTPLNAIIGFTNLLNDPATDEQKLVNYQRIIKSSGITLLQLINDVVDFSKIEAGQLEIFMGIVNVNELLQNIYHTFYENNKNTNIELILNNSLSDNIAIKTDGIRLTQILNNLLGNAFKFTKQGVIEFGVKQIDSNNDLVFYVKDTGIGIDKKDHDIIFNRFTKIDKNTKNLYRGVGLGLAITKHLVGKLGGKISLTSEIGMGSEFVFTLPYLHQQQEVLAESNKYKELVLNTNWSDKVFLIADDEPTNLLTLKSLLAKTKVKIYEATDGVEALDLFIHHQQEIDIVLLDIKMPNKDGVQTFKEIREINQEVVILAQTAYAMANEELDIRNVGFTDYISKPILKGPFFRLLHKYLNK